MGCGQEFAPSIDEMAKAIDLAYEIVRADQDDVEVPKLDKDQVVLLAATLKWYVKPYTKTPQATPTVGE